MELVRFNAYNNFPTGLQFFHDAVNRVLNDQNQSRLWSPTADVFETATELIFKVDTAGVCQEDIDIQIENGTMTLKGERKSEKDDTVKGYHILERNFGAFARSFRLPDTVDPESVRADYAYGVLTITLAKKELAKPRAIKVNVN